MVEDNKFQTNVPHITTGDNEKILYPFSPPIFQSEVDPIFVKELIEEGNKLTIKDDDYNDKLAGNLKYGRSYHYKTDYVRKVEPYLKGFVERFINGLIGDDPKNGDIIINNFLNINLGNTKRELGVLRLDSLWINYYKAGDFNPSHVHSCEVSFVIMCKIPEKIFLEQADSNTELAGYLVFDHGVKITEFSGTDFPIKPYENLMFVFPSKLKHYVYPYFVDEERISVSGNFAVISKEQSEKMEEKEYAST